MKLVSHYFEQIQGLEYYPIFVLLLFFSLFIVIMWMILKADKQKMQEYAKFPLDNNEIETEIKKTEYHG